MHSSSYRNALQQLLQLCMDAVFTAYSFVCIALCVLHSRKVYALDTYSIMYSTAMPHLVLQHSLNDMNSKLDMIG